MNDKNIKQIDKINKWLECILNILLIILTLVITIILSWVPYHKNKTETKQSYNAPIIANAQEITYTIKQGVYKFNPQLVFNNNQLPNQTGIDNVIENKQIPTKEIFTFTPIFWKNTDLDRQANKSTLIDIWVGTMKVQVAYAEIENGDIAGRLDIYNNANGWMYYLGTVNNSEYAEQAIPIDTYEVAVSEDVEVTEYQYWWWTTNTKTQTGATTDFGGYNDGYEAGYEQGQADKVQNEYGTYESAYNAGHTAGYDEGFTAGYNKYAGENPYTFHNLITAVIRAPSEFIKSFWGTEILGINLAGLFSAMITVAVVISVFALIKKFI